MSFQRKYRFIRSFALPSSIHSVVRLIKVSQSSVTMESSYLSNLIERIYNVKRQIVNKKIELIKEELHLEYLYKDDDLTRGCEGRVQGFVFELIKEGAYLSFLEEEIVRSQQNARYLDYEVRSLESSQYICISIRHISGDIAFGCYKTGPS